MSNIQILDDQTINQIAAGEVVERPASIVKELVENAIDAGACRINITTELGGKRLIRVEDDGEGMSREDACLALERHATSKLTAIEDLSAIRTLGFRGEALPSIASACHFQLKTRSRGSEVGTEVQVDGGVTSSVREVGVPEGTAIEVTDLFYNLPARRKFLKSDSAESRHISRAITQIALGYPEIGFSLTSATRTLLQCAPVVTLAERLFQIYGDRPHLVEVQKKVAGIVVTGFITTLADKGPVKGLQTIFVNRRLIKDRTISHAIIDAYSQATIKHRSPEVHLFIELAPDRVDINVHPMKAEVRFLEQPLMHEILRRTIGEALGQAGAPELQVKSVSSELSHQETTQSIPGVFSGMSVSSRWVLGKTSFEPFERSVDSGRPLDLQAKSLNTTGPDEIKPMIPLGQFRDTFIIAVDDEGVVIVDQHVAHERVLFEKVMEQLTAGQLESQRLLEPVLINLLPDQLQTLISHSTDLARFGFEVDEFGGENLRVTSLPALLDFGSCEIAIQNLANDLDALGDGSLVQEALKQIAATTACHAAVKANDSLTQEKMSYILDELRKTSYSTVCPHGRPVVLRLTRDEIEKRFERI